MQFFPVIHSKNTCIMESLMRHYEVVAKKIRFMETGNEKIKETNDFKRNISRIIWKQLLSLIGLTATFKANVRLCSFFVFPSL